jgi:hypothetical protein
MYMIEATGYQADKFLRENVLKVEGRFSKLMPGRTYVKVYLLIVPEKWRGSDASLTS